MVSYAAQACDRWRDGEPLDVAAEMARLTLAVVGKTLFDADVEKQAEDIGTALTDVLDSFWITLLPLADIIEQLPVPVVQRAQASRRRLDRIIYELITRRRAAGIDRGDLLSMLLAAREEGGRLTDGEVRDEAMTLLLAGHETTANALAWTWYLLGQTPAAEAALHE
jgi:cytochrome P450